MVSRQSLHSMTSCLPVDLCSICGLSFWWFRRDSLHVTPQASSTIRHNFEIFHVMLSNLMLTLERLIFCKAIRRNATPFLCTLYHSTLGWAISSNATLFVCTLYVHCTILHYAEPIHATVHRLYVCCAIRNCAKPFHATPQCMCVLSTTGH